MNQEDKKMNQDKVSKHYKKILRAALLIFDDCETMSWLLPSPEVAAATGDKLRHDPELAEAMADARTGYRVYVEGPRLYLELE